MKNHWNELILTMTSNRPSVAVVIAMKSNSVVAVAVVFSCWPSRKYSHMWVKQYFGQILSDLNQIDSLLVVAIVLVDIVVW